MLGLNNQKLELTIFLNWHRSLPDCHRGVMLINQERFEVVGPPGDICVTSGNYEIVLERSYKFDRILPELKGVPGRDEIKFHGFNYGWQSTGCIGPGRTGGVNYVNDSWPAVEEMIEILQKAIDKNQSIRIEIIKSEDASMNVFRELSRIFLPQAVEDELVKLIPAGGIVEKVISNEIKDKIREHGANALEVISAAKDCEKELEDFINAGQALSEKMKQNAIKTKATYDDKPFIWFDNLVDMIANAVKGKKPE